MTTPRTSKLNNLAMFAACGLAVASGLSGHLYISIAISLLGAALCAAIIFKEPSS
jgi:hypothetical protein